MALFTRKRRLLPLQSSCFGYGAGVLLEIQLVVGCSNLGAFIWSCKALISEINDSHKEVEMMLQEQRCNADSRGSSASETRSERHTNMEADQQDAVISVVIPSCEITSRTKLAEFHNLVIFHSLFLDVHICISFVSLTIHTLYYLATIKCNETKLLYF